MFYHCVIVASKPTFKIDFISSSLDHIVFALEANLLPRCRVQSISCFSIDPPSGNSRFNKPSATVFKVTFAFLKPVVSK